MRGLRHARREDEFSLSDRPLSLPGFPQECRSKTWRWGLASAAGRDAAVSGVSGRLPREQPSSRGPQQGKNHPPRPPAPGFLPEGPPELGSPRGPRSAPGRAVRARLPREAEGSGPARCPQPSRRPYPRLPLGGTSPPGMSRPEPPGPSQPCPGRGRAPQGLRRGAAAVGAAPARSVCPRRGPSLHPSRARLPRPPSHSSSQ